MRTEGRYHIGTAAELSGYAKCVAANGNGNGDGNGNHTDAPAASQAAFSLACLVAHAFFGYGQLSECWVLKITYHIDMRGEFTLHGPFHKPLYQKNL